MTKVAAIIASSLLAVSCASVDRPGTEKYGREALDLCIHEAENVAIDVLAPAVDQVYMYARAQGAWQYMDPNF
jgi:hypothetical protein